MRERSEPASATPEGGAPFTAGSELTYDELIRELFPRLTGGVRWGLERTTALLESVGNPHNSYRTIHVGGTNGKGSVAASIAAVLREAGRFTGLYTSPHLCTFRERIQIGADAISPDALLSAAKKLWPAIGKLKPSFFEATTAIGFLALAEAGVDIAVIEVGLGGRLDSTNVITPEISIITNIALDHAEYLGNTIGSIAREKAGIIKPGVPVFTAEEATEPLAIFQQAAHEQLVRIERPHAVSFDLHGTTFSLGDRSYHTPLVGHHQAVNAALAIQAISSLPEIARDASALTRGLAKVKWPGRLQVEHIDKETWVFDVAHNVAGVHALVDAVTVLQLPKPLVLVVGILGDKDWGAMLPPLFELADHVILTRPPTAPANRSWDPSRVLQSQPSENAIVETDFAVALSRAARQADGGSVIVTGSFHTVGDALIMLDRAPFGSDISL